MLGWDLKVYALIEIPKLKFDQDLYGTCDMNSTLGSVAPLAMFLNLASWSSALVTIFLNINKISQLNLKNILLTNIIRVSRPKKNLIGKRVVSWKSSKNQSLVIKVSFQLQQKNSLKGD